MTKNTNNNSQNKFESCSIMPDEYNPYKCKLCNEPAFENTNKIASHIAFKHKNDMKYEEYFKKYITADMLKIFIQKHLLKSSFPLETRLTDMCLECSQPNCKFITFGAGFSIFCSLECSYKNKIQIKNRTENARKTLKDKYGVDNPAQVKGHGDRVKNTKKERYGDENYTNLEKMKETNQTRYGVDNYMQSKEIKEATQLKYGVDYIMQTQEFKDKVIETNKTKYGYEQILQVPSIREQIKETNMIKYGATTILTTPAVVEILRIAIQEKYGADNVWQVPEMLEKSHKVLKDRFVSRLEKKELIGVTIVDPYKKEFNCDYCNTNFIVKRISLNSQAGARAPRCPECFPVKETNGISTEEKELLLFLQHNFPNDTILHNHKGLINTNPKLEVDIYFPDKKIAIEYNGTYWHTEVMGNKKQDYHLFKTKKLWDDHGIQLIHVFSDDWKSKNTIMKSKLLHRLGANKKEVIHARKCIVSFAKKDDTQELNDLYKNNHLQGTYRKSSKHVIARYNHKIVAAMSFSFSPKKQTIELERFCADINYNINGIGSRLFSKFINNKTLLDGYINIVSFADICWTHPVKNVYESMGFVKESSQPPRYWYIENHKEVKLHRFNFRKNRLPKLLKAYNPNLTEWDNMYAHGYDRLWDCGLYRYVYTL